MKVYPLNLLVFPLGAHTHAPSRVISSRNIVAMMATYKVRPPDSKSGALSS